MNNLMNTINSFRNTRANYGRASELAEAFDKDERLDPVAKARLRSGFNPDYSNVQEVNALYGDLLDEESDRSSSRLSALLKQQEMQQKMAYKDISNTQSGVKLINEMMEGAEPSKKGFLGTGLGATKNTYLEDPAELEAHLSAAAQMGLDPNIMKTNPAVREALSVLGELETKAKEMGLDPSSVRTSPETRKAVEEELRRSRRLSRTQGITKFGR